MNDNDVNIPLNESQSLISDDYYFKYIFKKTEKIICAVFYILNKDKVLEKSYALCSEIERTALETLTYVNGTLQADVLNGYSRARELGFKLMGLESRLRVLSSAGYLNPEHLNVFIAEIDSVLRSVKNYDGATYGSDRAGKGASSRRLTGRVQRTDTVRESKGQSEVVGSQGQQVSRRDRIVAVLKAQPGASIKDISDTVKDCSEKTIQRELIELINTGLVRKDGERRWSKYSYIGQ